MYDVRVCVFLVIVNMTLQISHFTSNCMLMFVFLVCWKHRENVKLTKICFYSRLSVILKRNLDDIMSHSTIKRKRRKKKNFCLLCCITYIVHETSKMQKIRIWWKKETKIKWNKPRWFHLQSRKHKKTGMWYAEFSRFSLSWAIRSEFFFWPTNATTRKQQ